MVLITADWTPLTRNVYYRKTELYTMDWEKLNLADYIIAAASFGGPIAMCLNEKKLRKVFVHNCKPTINIFSASGQSLSHITWESGKLIHLAWTFTEDLLCITENGDIHCYDIHGKNQKVTSTGMEAKDVKVLDCKVFISPKNRTGVAVLTGAYHIFFINNIKEPRVREMPSVPGLVAPPSSWAVVTDDRTTKVILAKDSLIYILDQGKDKCILVAVEFDEIIKHSAITEIAVSFNHENIALFADNGHLWIGSSNLMKKHYEVDTERKTRPEQLMWFGNNAVVGLWPDFADSWIITVFYHNFHLNYSYCSPIHLVPEIDSLRIISNTMHELLQKVPDAVADVFRIGSVSPSALLLEASEEFQNKNHKSDEYMRMIREKNELEVAINNCIHAAGHEFEPSRQKMLLRAASYGKSYIPDMDPEPHVLMCKKLRVLNTVRINKIGLPLTFKQFEYLTLHELIARLVLRHHYPIAIAICQYMGIPDVEGRSRILSQWACYKVKRTVADPELTAQVIAKKLGHTPGISYSEVSNKAMDFGHMQLAITLLDYETRASEQVPLLIKLEQVTQAMNKAIESGNTDLVFTVIFHMKDTVSKGSFHREIRRFPEAYSLYLKFCKEQDLVHLRENYYQDSNYNADADCHVFESCRLKKLEQRITSLLAAVDSYKKAKNEFATQITEDQVKLLRYQEKLGEKLQDSYSGLSLHETIRKLLSQREYDKADLFRKEFKVPDRRFWWLKMTVLADGGEWLELEKFSKSKKPPPIGFEPFVDVCMKHENTFEAKRYLPKVKDENKVKYCIRVGMLEDGAKAAFEQKDVAALNHIQSLCGIMDRTLSEKIMTMKSQLGSKR